MVEAAKDSKPVKAIESFWRESKNRPGTYWVEYDKAVAGIIEHLDGTMEKLGKYLDKDDQKKTQYTRDGIVYSIWETEDDKTKEKKWLVFRNKEGEGGGGKGKGGKWPNTRVKGSRLILQGLPLEKLGKLPVDGMEFDCKMVNDLLAKPGKEWNAPGTSGDGLVAAIMLDELNQQLIVAYSLVQKEKLPDAEPAKDEKKG